MKFSYIFISIIFFSFYSCVENNTLTLEILNKELVTYSKGICKDTTNILRYRLKNNSNNIYYINSIIGFNTSNGITEAKTPNRTLKVYEINGKEVDYIPVFFNAFNFDSMLSDKITRLGYDKYSPYYTFDAKDYSFFIHPNEQLYFECIYPIQINKFNNENLTSSYAKIIKNRNYECQLNIFSDSVTANNILPLNIKQIIKANKVKIYHGIIKSKNKVPVRILE
jgi:hypothetical protein